MSHLPRNFSHYWNHRNAWQPNPKSWDLVPDCLCFCINWSDSWEQKGVNPPFIRGCGAHLKSKMINRLVGQIRVWKFWPDEDIFVERWRDPKLSMRFVPSLFYGWWLSCLSLLTAPSLWKSDIYLLHKISVVTNSTMGSRVPKKKKTWVPVIPIMYAWV